MTYSATRDSEQMRYLNAQIQEFILRYEGRNVRPGDRKTLILFAGGMGSELIRAKTPYNPAGPVNQTFQYDTVWLTLETLLGGALDLKMHIATDGTAHDLQDRIIISNGTASLFGVSPYTIFQEWCDFYNIDWFAYGFDWRLSMDDRADFFVNLFLPALQTEVKNQTGNDPLANLILVGHSAGGMVLNLAMQINSAYLNGVQQAITVGAPFYGYGGQLHRYFEGNSYFNMLGIDNVIETIASFPGCYAYNYMDIPTYTANAAAFAADAACPLLDYPSKDKTVQTTDVDPYSPGPDRYPTGIGVTTAVLTAALATYKKIAAGPPAGPKLDALYCIRGVQQSNSTVDGIHWESLAISYRAGNPPDPVTNDPGLTPGDDTQPGWTARLLGLPPSHIFTVPISSLGHMFMMNEPNILTTIGTLIGV